jgi:hypothetical protein
MRRWLILLFLLGWMSQPLPVTAQEDQATPVPGIAPTSEIGTSTPEPGPAALGIRYPNPDDLLQGVIPITVDINLPGINTWELAFSFAENPTDTWFLLASGSEPFNGQLLTWDTTQLSDGNYSLRLRAYYSDAYQDILVTPVRVRNYSSLDTPTPAESNTPTPSLTPSASPVQLPSPTPTYTAVIRLTPTPLPPNPASIENSDIAGAALRGAAYSLLAFAIIGLLAWLKRKTIG